MKILRLSLIAVLAIVFFACQKDLSSPELTSAAKGGGGGSAPPPAFVYTAPTFDIGCETTPYSFSTSMTKKNGDPIGGNNNSIEAIISQAGLEISRQTIELPTATSSTTVTFNFGILAAGQYNVVVYFRHANSDNAAVNIPLSFTLTIQSSDNCGGGGGNQCTADGVSLTRSASIIEADETGRIVNISKTYTVHNCSENEISKLKLQGGLVNKASLLSTPTEDGGATDVKYSAKTTNGNTVLTWTFNLPAGATHTFSVSYKVWGTSCGSPLSGAWSLKNSAGTPIGVAPEDESAVSSGYLDRLYWNCQ